MDNYILNKLDLIFHFLLWLWDTLSSTFIEVKLCQKLRIFRSVNKKQVESLWEKFLNTIFTCTKNLHECREHLYHRYHRRINSKKSQALPQSPSSAALGQTTISEENIIVYTNFYFVLQIFQFYFTIMKIQKLK